MAHSIMKELVEVLVSPRDLISCEPNTTLQTAISLMRAERIGALPVMDGGVPVGIFTERDYLTRIAGSSLNLNTSTIESFMVKDPATIASHRPIEEMVMVMHQRRFRHLLVRYESKASFSVASIKDLLNYLPEDLPIFSAPTKTLLAGNPPVTCEEMCSLADAVNQMRSHHIGSLLVTHHNGTLSGIFTERDVLFRVAPGVLDFRHEVVKTFMTPEPRGITVSRPMRDALRELRIGRFRHIVAYSDDRTLCGVISAKDILDHVAKNMGSLV